MRVLGADTALQAASIALATTGSVAAGSVARSPQTYPTLSPTQIQAYKPFTFFAYAAYCPSVQTINWSCGSTCQANPDFQPIVSGGDGTDIQFWYVGFDPSLVTVIVGHQGTNRTSLTSWLTDGDLVLDTLDPTLFPGIPYSIEVHRGFAKEHAKTAIQVLAAVQQSMLKFGSTSVIIVGHSMGGALSLLDAVYLRLHLPATTVLRTITYGLPRVGNQAFANYVDEYLNLTHINNMKDPIPIIPGRFLGYVHASGEIHIMANNSWVLCPGQDNESKECADGDVHNILEGKESDHDGPYDGVSFALNCP